MTVPANMPRIFSFLRRPRCIYIYNGQTHQLAMPNQTLPKTPNNKPHSSLQMAAARLLRSSGPLGLGLPPPPSSSSSSSYCTLNNSTLSSNGSIRHLGRSVGTDKEKRLSVVGGCEKRPLVAAKAAAATSDRVITSEPQTNSEVDSASLALRKVADTALMILKLATKRRRRKLIAQMFIERAVVDCRFFTLFAVAGSLLGSVLCFMEGCFIVMESYLQYLQLLSLGSDQGHVVQLLIEAIDMFLVGTAMVIFGTGLHVTFVGSKGLKGKSSQLPGSNLFGLFYLKTLPRWVSMQSVTEAKSKMGHAVIMILQVGVLEKFKSVPLVTGLDLACFAGAVFVSSACIFLLSRLSVGPSK